MAKRKTKTYPKEILADLHNILRPIVDFLGQDEGGPILSLAASLHSLSVEYGAIEPEKDCPAGYITEDALLACTEPFNELYSRIQFVNLLCQGKVRIHLDNGQIRYSARGVKAAKEGEQ